MNKRIKKKIEKSKNMNRHLSILKEISKRFKINKKTFIDVYFIFNMGACTICHFTLKDTPDWLYGIWLNDKGFDIFGEHTDLIDKFKPSRTYLSYKDDLKSFIKDVKAIKENPKLYFVDSLTYGDALVDYSEEDNAGYQLVRNYSEEAGRAKFSRDESITQEDFVNKEYDNFIAEKLKRISDENNDKKFAFDFFRELPNMYAEIIAVGIFDSNNNKSGFKYNPRYKLSLVVNKDLTQIEFNDFYDKIKKVIDDKSYSSSIKTFKHNFSLDYMTDGLKIIKDCDYVFKRKSL